MTLRSMTSLTRTVFLVLERMATPTRLSICDAHPTT